MPSVPVSSIDGEELILADGDAEMLVLILWLGDAETLMLGEMLGDAEMLALGETEILALIL